MVDVGVFTPHADDRDLTLGATVRRLLEDGHNVWSILMTTGVNSSARAGTGLGAEEFGRARDDEDQRSGRILGLRPENILISPLRPDDGQLTLQVAELIIYDWLSEHPGAWVKTTTNLGGEGQHTDHRIAGQAAVNLLRNGEIIPNGLRLGVEQYQLQAFKTANPTLANKLSVDRAARPEVVQAALDVYGETDPAGWKFGIGHRSVKSAFDLVRANPVSYYHVPVL